MEKIRVDRSFIAADSLAEVVEKYYDLGGPVSCKMFSKLLRTQDNDHYRVAVGNTTHVLRLYQQGDSLGREEADYLFELEWLQFLYENGLPVSYALPCRDGRLLSAVDAPEGKRYFALFTYAQGKRMAASDEEQLFEVGAKMGQLHLVSDGFRSERQRAAVDLTMLYDEPLHKIKRSWSARQASNLDILLASAEEARDEIISLLGDAPQEGNSAWGVIGGDFHFMSIHFKGGQPTFFNFDRCGYGWRAYDIAAFLSNLNLLQEPEDLSEAFFAGYYSQRPLAPEEHAAVHPFLTLRRLWRMGLFALDTGLAGYTFLAPA